MKRKRMLLKKVVNTKVKLMNDIDYYMIDGFHQIVPCIFARRAFVNCSL